MKAENVFDRAYRRRQLLRGASLLGLVVAGGGAFVAGRPATADISGQTIRFVNYTNWIGAGEYDEFLARTGCEVREIPTNHDRSQRVVADPTSVDMVLDPLGPLGLINAAGLLATLDLSRIPNYELVHASFKRGLASPEQSKAVPIDWGRTGILYRADLVSEPMTSWADFWAAAPAYTRQVLLPDSQDHALRNALLMLGLDGSSEDAAEIDRAAEAIIAIKPYVGAFGAVDTVKRLLDGSAVMAMAEDWQGSSAVRENPEVDLVWIDPSEGAAGYLDCIGAPTTTEVLPAVEDFLNFHLEPEIAANFCNTLSVAPIMPASEPYIDAAIKDNPITNPPSAVLDRISYWSYLGNAQRLWDDAWARVKSA